MKHSANCPCDTQGNRQERPLTFGVTEFVRDVARLVSPLAQKLRCVASTLPRPRSSPILANTLGDHIGYTVGMDLFRSALGAERRPLPGEGSDDDDSPKDRKSATSRATPGGAGWGDEGGGVDCELLVAGSYLHAHRMVLASRSPVFRDMIAQVRPHDVRVPTSCALSKGMPPPSVTIRSSAPGAVATDGLVLFSSFPQQPSA